MTEHAILCAHCQIAVVATATGEWEGADLDIFGPMVCDACACCLAEKGVQCQGLLETVLQGRDA